MALGGRPPPPPVKSEPGSFAWSSWYNELYEFLVTSGTVAWSSVSKAGASLADLPIRLHNVLQSIQGGTAGEYYHLTSAQHTAVTSGLSESIDDRVSSLLVAGTNITLTYNDGANTLTIDSSGGGGGSTVLSEEITITCDVAGTYYHEEDVAFTGLLPTHKIVMSVAPHDDTDENSIELLNINAMSALAGTDVVSIAISFTDLTSGPIKLNLMAV